MKLFEYKHRTENKPAEHLVNIYDFYDRSSSDDVDRIRNTLNQWFDNYPDSEKVELKKRFQKSFSSTFYELFLHQLFLKQGFTLEPHPEVPGTTKRPDFLVIGNNIEFYLEAKESTDKSDSEKSFENRINRLYDCLNTIDSPNFFFAIRELNLKSSAEPSAKKIKDYLESELKKFDPDTITEQKKHGLDATETITFEDENVRLVISLISKSPELRGKPDVRPIGIYPFQSFWGGADESIKTAIKKKATRYGLLDKPYLICINATSERGLYHSDVMNALFGTLQDTFSTNPVNRDEQWTRALDGAFSGTKFKRVSAILITHVKPANLHVANHWLVKHPFAVRELPIESFRFHKFEMINKRIKTIKGDSIKDILEIPDDWMNY